MDLQAQYTNKVTYGSMGSIHKQKQIILNYSFLRVYMFSIQIDKNTITNINLLSRKPLKITELMLYINSLLSNQLLESSLAYSVSHLAFVFVPDDSMKKLLIST